MSDSVECVEVALDRDRHYDIVIGADILGTAGHYIKPLLKRPRLVVVSDDTVANLHWQTLQKALEDTGIDAALVRLPPGEQTKSYAHLEELLERLIALNVERQDIVAAFGGGVVGDLTGFAASVLRRGVNFIQIPTTLLAQVDSSVGGKTAINSHHAKNLIGAFHQPRLVICDTALLDSLPRRDRNAGYAEIVKYGLLGDRAFYNWLEANGHAVIAGDRAALRHAVAESCRQKAAIVARDEKENDVRALLNLGHTFGHAFEHYVHFDPERLRHGEAVALGCILAFAFSVRQGLCSKSAYNRVRRHFAAIGLPVDLQDIGLNGIDSEALIHAIKQDKKVEAGQLTFILARDIGDAFICRDYGPADVREFFQSCFRNTPSITA